MKKYSKKIYYKYITNILQKRQLYYSLSKCIDFYRKKIKINISVDMKEEVMASCLGLYIENNLIKYARVTKEKDNYKIDSFGIKFYSNIDDAIEQIVQETNSLKIPISVNLVNENYQYFSMFAQLNKNDLDKAIRMEFESYCTEKGYNANLMETRYACVDDTDTTERIRVINISESLTELNKINENLGDKKLESILPLPMVLPNIVELNGKENVIIVNLEQNTTITTIHGKYIFDIQTMEEGSATILENISKKENSLAKSYEMLKNTTIYTSNLETQDLEENNEQMKYLEDILPSLYSIISKVQEIASQSVERIEKIYLTGTLANINNIDLYFQEYFGENTRCEILKPSIIKNNYKDENIKEYIEVNSAISLALQGLGKGIKGINFKKDIFKMDLKDIFSSKTLKLSQKSKKDKKEFYSFSGKITKDETWLVRLSMASIIFIISYVIFSQVLIKQIKQKQEEVTSVTSSIKSEINKIVADTATLNGKATKYSTLIDQLNEINQKISAVAENKYLIPNLLAQIARSIDNTVQITSISNPYDKHIVIEAQSNEYPGLGYFKTKLDKSNILQNVVAGGGIKQGDVITVTIEGDLP